MSYKKKQQTKELNLEKYIARTVDNILRDLNGVSKLVGGFTANITDTVLGRESYIPGIWIDKSEDQYIIGIRIKVYYGINIPQLSYDIQTRIKNGLSESDINIKSINISIEGIDRVGD